MYHNPLFCQNYDNAIRWQPNERLDHLFEARVDRLARERGNNHPAVITGGAVLTYDGLDRAANQLARYLRQLGVGPDDRVGIMLRQSAQTYAALLAILKSNAAYVPLDPNFPTDRLRFIAEDAGIEKIVTLSEYRELLEGLPVEPIFIDEVSEAIRVLSDARLSPVEKGKPKEELCYIVYTSGSTGRPKGVAIEHPSICNFVRVAAEVYGYREEDRVYQGMTIAFDFSVEEIWVPLMAGATLVPGVADATLVGKDLADFLFANEVTALCCVPTLLATIDRDLPSLRLLLVSGEACPHDLVVRWHRPGRTILNAYGPTEATVTATWTELTPDKPVTIGVPMPTYSIVILDENENKVVPDGASGEICIAGIGLAKGYLNRADLTDKAFIPDFLHLTNNPSGRIYRTGDLGRILEAGEIEYQGRIDTQVKVRGYRIELTEIESVLMEVPEVAQAVVNTWIAPGSTTKELVAYVTLKDGVSELPRDAIAELLRGRLPGYMVPSYLELLGEMPMLPSHKADRKALPPPAGPRFVAGSSAYVAPSDEIEQTIADALGGVLGVDQISAADDFFTDLGGHSLLMARFASSLRERIPGADVSMRDIYLNPTVAKLAGVLRSGARAAPAVRRVEEITFRKPGFFAYYGCGLLQLLFYVTAAWIGIEILVFGLNWIIGATSLINLYLRILSFGTTAFIVFSALPILLKWLLIGRWEEQRFRVWGLQYFRFWVVKQFVQTNPLLLFRDTPIYNIYLRLLGAKIGRHAVIRAKSFPVCTDLIEIGDNAVLRNGSIVLGYKAEAGHICMAPIKVGKNAIVGEASLLDIDTIMEDGAQLAHASALLSGQRIPAGKSYHGTPAQECGTNFNSVEPRECSTRRRVIYSAVRVVTALFLGLPLLPLLLFLIFPAYFGPDQSAQKIAAGVYSLSPGIALALLGMTTFFLVTSFIGGLMRIAALPRVANLLLEEDRTYVLYGFHYFLFNIVARASNSIYFNILFGDSSYIVGYLQQLVGMDLAKVVQTGSNFGTEQAHDTPFLCTVGTGTMVSSGLTMVNLRQSSTSFRLSRAAIGEDNFTGNVILYPPGGATGKNVLLATKVMVPVDGEIRENIGLLGSPPFEIPRSAGAEPLLSQPLSAQLKQERLRAKNKANIKSMLAYVGAGWCYGFAGLVTAYLIINLYGAFGIPAALAATFAFAVFSVVYFAFIERLSLVFGRMKPRKCIVLDPYYWQVEHHWRFSETVLKQAFKGTPFRNVVMRMLGMKVGRRVFDDGAVATEKTLVEIGDYCTLNEYSLILSHSLEGGIFKSDQIKLGTGCTVGTSAVVHYGVTMGDRTVLHPDAFLMKGTVLAPDTAWQGNPAYQFQAA